MKLRPTSYAFDASAKTIICAGFTSLEAILLVTNVTDNIIIYNFADSSKGGTLSGTTLTLEYDTTSMDDADKLQIFVEDGTTTNAVSAASLPLPSGAATSAKQDTMIGHLDGVEGVLATIDTDTGTIATEVAGLLTDTELRATPVPVSGTVAVTNAGITTIAGAVAGTEMQVDVLTSALPSGAATSAKQDTIIGHVDGIEGLLTTIAGDTTDIEAALETAGGLVVNLGANNDVTVTGTVAATQSGTWDEVGINDSGNSITVDAVNLDVRDIDAATDDITIHGDVGVIDQLDLTNSNPAVVAIVDGDGTQITSFGGGTQYTEGGTDATITGTALLFEGEADTLVAAPGTAANGLDVDVTRVSGTVTVDGSGVTQPVSNAGLTELAAAINSSKVDVNIVSSDVATGGTSAVDDADFTDNTTPGTPGMGVYESTPTTVTDGDLGVVGITTDRRLKTSADTELPAAAALADDTANPTVPGVGAFNHVFDGSVWHRMLGDNITGLAVEITNTTLTTIPSDVNELGVWGEDAAHTTGDKGVFALGVRNLNFATLTSDELDYSPFAVDQFGRTMTLSYSRGDTQHDAADDGEPVKIGGYAKAAAPTDVSADADRVNAWFLRNGAQATVITAAGALIGGDATNGLDVDVTRVSGNVAVTNAGITTIAGAVSGTEMQVDVLTMPTVTVTATNLDVQSGGADLATSAQGAAIQTAVEILDNAIAGSEMQVDVVGALPAGTNAIGKLAANSGVDIGDVDVTSISAGTNAIGNVGLIGRTTGGLSIFRSIDLDETEEEVKATAGQVFTITAFNRTAAPLYLKLYNATTANVTVGTTTPVMTFLVPANADSDGAGFIHSTDIGYAFGTAITAAVTTGVADNDTGAPGANDCLVNIGYM